MRKMLTKRFAYCILIGVVVLLVFFGHLFVDPQVDPETGTRRLVSQDLGRHLRWQFEKEVPVIEEIESEDEVEAGRRRTDFVFYNRVPKCGSRSVLHVLSLLSQINNFSFESNLTTDQGRKYFNNRRKLENFVEELSVMQGPMVFSRHLYYVNFTRFGHKQPLYINVVRDPVQRHLSHFYYAVFGSFSGFYKNRSKANLNEVNIDDCFDSEKNLSIGYCQPKNLITYYFCGHTPVCRASAMTALQRAKRVIERDYTVVGLTEDIENFMRSLEFFLPQFFRNATNIFKADETQVHRFFSTFKKKKPLESTIQIIRQELSMDLELYDFIKKRFYDTLNSIQGKQGEGKRKR